MTDERNGIGAVIAALEGLGSTPDEIAATLAAKGVWGVRKSSRHCPLANYLSEQFPPPHHRAVVGCDTAVAADTTVPMPDACHDFVWRFDDGAYPDIARDHWYDG